MAIVRYHVALTERVLRSISAVFGGAVQETAELVLPRVVRRSRFYEATAKNLLRILVELIGGVEPAEPAAVPVGELAIRKGAGNVVEIGSIAAFGFSPLWLLAGASDLLHGSRVYLGALVDELKRAGVLAVEAEATSVDDLLGVLERGTGRTAALIDVPPLELAQLRRSLAELAAERQALPSAAELATLYEALRRTARREDRSLLEVSSGIGLAFLTSARLVTREHVVVPYGEDWRPVWREGFAAYARRVAVPYRRAVEAQLRGERLSVTERALRTLGRKGGATVGEILDRSGISYERLPHPHTESAAAEAQALGLTPGQIAKTLVLRTAARNVRAVIPASCRIDLGKLHRLVGGSKKELQFLSEEELGAAYGEFELGAVPPFGGPEGDRVIVDGRLAELESVVLEAGSHDESVRLATADLIALTKADVADICRD
jgi:prolyl-tRNA editing enzyme YbaK/EbsC (Cys-tRNA(Pro) deacylase)